MAKITSSSFGLSSTGERLGGKSKIIKISAPERSLLKILNNIDVTLKSILTTLTGAAKEDKKLLDKQRKEEENKRRSEREKGLESKVFDGIKVAAKTVMKPFTSIWDWITNFFWNVFLGKVVIKLLNWFSDPKNKDKIKSIVRFFKDWWPTMLGAYILFGTSFGKLARGLVGFAGKAVIGLGKIIGRLLFAVKKGRALKTVSGAGGGRGPKGGGGRGIGGTLLKGALAIGGTLLTGYAIDKGTEALMGGNEEKEGGENLKIDVPDAPEIPMLNAATGGLADIGKIFGKFGGGAGLGAMFGPLGMLMGMGMGALPQMFQGLVSGKKGTDKIPAMLTDGEFVMSKGAVQKYGVDTLESMNAAGGGSSIPKIVKGVPHAAEGGLISKSPDFWKLSALASKEDGQNPQGQADVAQSIYNRSATGAYPGGKSIGDIIMGKDSSGAWQYQPVRDNYSAFSTIKDKKSAAAAVGENKLNMAVKSITNPALQQNAKGFVGGRTDFMGESQKKYMKPGDITRGKNYNFHGWFYNAKLNSPAPTPSIVSQASQSQTPTNKPSDSKPQNKPGFNLFDYLPKLKFQEGGLIPERPLPNTLTDTLGGGGGGTDAITEQSKVKTFGDTLRDIFSFGNKNPKYDPQEYKMGGMIGENSGSNYGPGGEKLTGRDRQFLPIGGGGGAFLEPGEVVIRKKTVNDFGANNLLALNSPTVKNGYKSSPALSRNQRRRTGVKPPIRPPATSVMFGSSGRKTGGTIMSGSRPTGNTPPVRATSDSPQSKQTARQRGIG